MKLCMCMRLGVAVALIGCAGAAQGEVVRWIAAGGGDFGVGSNWDRGTPPGALDVAVFDLNAAYTVTVSQDLQLYGLRMSGGPVTVAMTGRTVRLGAPIGLPGDGLYINGAVRFEGGLVAMGWGDVTIVGAPFEMMDNLISDKVTGAGRNSRADVSGVVHMVDSGLGLRTPTLAAEFDMVRSSVGGEFVTVGAADINGGLVGSSEGTFVLGPARASGGAVITGGQGSFPLVIAGAITAEGAGTRLEKVSSIGGGEVRVRDGAFLDSAGSSIGIRGAGRLVLEAGGAMDGGVWMDNGSSLRVEPDSTGPATLEIPSGVSTNQMELVIDAARTPRFVPPEVVTWDGSRIGGRLVVEVLNPNPLRVGDEVPLLTCAATISGAFTQIQTPSLGGGRQIAVSVEPHQVVARVVAGGEACWSADFDGDGVVGTDDDIVAFFACLGGECCALCGAVDFNSDGDTGTDADIEAFFRVLGGGEC